MCTVMLVIPLHIHIYYKTCDRLLCHIYVLSFLAAANFRMSPSFGAVHTGGFVIVTGPNSVLFNEATAARIKFGDDSEELNCTFQAGRTTIICPVPLFPPSGTGMKVVTLTLDSFMMCTYKGQYRVGKSHQNWKIAPFSHYTYIIMHTIFLCRPTSVFRGRQFDDD